MDTAQSKEWERAVIRLRNCRKRRRETARAVEKTKRETLAAIKFALATKPPMTQTEIGKILGIQQNSVSFLLHSDDTEGSDENVE